MPIHGGRGDSITGRGKTQCNDQFIHLVHSFSKHCALTTVSGTLYRAVDTNMNETQTLASSRPHFSRRD